MKEVNDLASWRKAAWAAFVCLILPQPGCTDTGVEFLDRTITDRVAVSGEFCTSPPESFLRPIRVLFAIDSSDSMIFNDPEDIHVDAIQGTVERFRSEENISFGILRWGERVIRELVDYNPGDPVLFTKDEVRLNEAFARMRQLAIDNPDKFLGGTDYVNALEEIRSYLLQDSASNPDSSVYQRYLVMFITDGMPQAGDMDANLTRLRIMQEVQDLTQDFSVSMDVISIVQIAIIPPEFFNLLPDMARAGDGQYFQLSSPESLALHFDSTLESERSLMEFELDSVAVPSEPKSFFVSNDSVRVAEVDGHIDYYVDSDGDGLVDAIEFQLGTNPGYADSDGDGLDDFFEYTFLGEFDPLASMVPGLSEAQRLDEDGDGLIFFVEDRLGLDPDDADTDGDGLPDGVEFRLGTSPHVNDAFGDPDEDGLSNAVEIRQGTSPVHDERFLVGPGDGQRVVPISEPSAVMDGRRCYQFRVENIRLRETLPAQGLDGSFWPAGANRIHMWRLERPTPLREQDRDSPILDKYVKYIKGMVWIVYLPSEGIRDPAALELFVDDTHFDAP